MSTDAYIVFGILFVTVALFVSDRLRLDLVALMALLGLMLSGVLEPKEGLAGFANPIVLMIAGLFAVEFKGILAFAREIHEFGNGGLHPIGHFMLLDPRKNLGITKLAVHLLVQRR